MFIFGTLSVLFCYTWAYNDIEKQSFRIIAPQFICPKDEHTLINSPDTTTVMIQTIGSKELTFLWTVRWIPLVMPTQRFTLLLWRSVRNLEHLLNRPQPEPLVFAIDNNQLLPDVDYIFNVAVQTNGMLSYKTFQIKNVSGKQILDLAEDQGELVSLVLLGNQMTYPDIEYLLKAQVTTCHPTQDYHFIWLIEDSISQTPVDNDANGSRLTIPPGKLTAEGSYDITCTIVKTSNNAFLNQMRLPVQVLRRGLEISLDADVLVMSAETAFEVDVAVFNNDYLPQTFNYIWSCEIEGKPCGEFFNGDYTSKLDLPSGLPDLGKYEISVNVKADNDSASAKITIITIKPRLPVLKVDTVRRVLNEGTNISLVGNASNIAPSCSLTWYFQEASQNSSNEDNEPNEHGTQLSDTVTIYSLEENFLNELADFTNDTEWRQVTVTMAAIAGRARFVAECGCSLTFSCETTGVVYADLYFNLNRSPTPQQVTVTPTSGVALETIFRISTQAAYDLDLLLRYSFYAGIGPGVSLLLDSYLDHLAVEISLPYIDGTTDVWVEVCDSLGACTFSEVQKVAVVAGGSFVKSEILEDDVRAHVKRCEIVELQRVVISTFATFKNTGEYDKLSELSLVLKNVLEMGLPEQCLQKYSEQYSKFLELLNYVGYDIKELK